MGRMLEALREIDSRRPPVPPSDPVESEIEPRIQPEIESEAPIAAPVDSPPDEAAEPAEAEFSHDVTIPEEVPQPEADRLPQDAKASQGPSSETVDSPSRYAATPDASEPPDGEPLDPRYPALADTMLAQLPADCKGALLLAGVDDNDVSGALSPLFPLIAQRIAGRAIVVDCNEGCRAFARRDDNVGSGSVGIDSDEAAWAPFVLQTSHPGLDLLLAAETPAEDASLPRLEPETLVSELRQAYQLVLLVGAPSSDREIASLAGLCDGTYLTIRLGETSRRRVGRTIHVLQRAAVDVLGCVLLEA